MVRNQGRLSNLLNIIGFLIRRILITKLLSFVDTSFCDYDNSKAAIDYCFKTHAVGLFIDACIQ